jgi:putative tricarboxylic transport membrane protein
MTGARAIALLLAACGALAAVQAWRAIPVGSLGEPGPGLLPFLLALALVALGAAAALEGRRPAPGPVDRRRALLVAALLVAYPAALPFLGFALTTTLALFLLGRALGSRAPGRLAIFAVASTAAAVVLFQRLLLVPLPRGPWGF